MLSAIFYFFAALVSCFRFRFFILLLFCFGTTAPIADASLASSLVGSLGGLGALGAIFAAAATGSLAISLGIGASGMACAVLLDCLGFLLAFFSSFFGAFLGSSLATSATVLAAASSLTSNDSLAAAGGGLGISGTATGSLGHKV